MMSSSESTGWMITGFQAIVGLATWVAVVLIYGLWRSFGGAEPDTIRTSGPHGRPTLGEDDDG